MNIKTKLFRKISLVFVISFIAVLFSSITIHRLFIIPERIPGILRNVVNHAGYMVREIGNPPDIKKAERISSEMKVGIRINSPEVDWASDTEMIGFEEIDLHDYPGKMGITSGFNDAGLCVMYEENSFRILLVMYKQSEGFSRVVSSIIVLIIGFTLLVIIILYFIIRWLLRPVKILKEGVDQVGRGNLDVQMEPQNNDELGQLISSFNSMALSIREMIKSRDQLLRDVSHELRSPLTRIRVALEMMKEGEGKKGILEDLTEIDTMISELLETERLNSKFGGIKLRRVLVRTLIDSVLKDFINSSPVIVAERIQKGLHIDIDIERGVILLRNILGNAVRYSKKDGKPVVINTYSETGNVIIEVIDSGIGIPEEELENIFEPFYRVDKSRSRETGGYGLGMSLSRKIMDAHNGEIEISSSYGKGTKVKLIFPL